MLTKIKTALASALIVISPIASGLWKMVTSLLSIIMNGASSMSLIVGIILGYVGHPFITIAIDLIKIPLKILSIF